MKLKIRYEQKYEIVEVNSEEMWVSLSLEGGEDLTQEEKETLIQDTFEDRFNKPEYNNWHKFDRHRGMPKKPFRKDDEAEDKIDHMDYFPDNSDEEAREKQAEYEYICGIIRKNLKEKQAELLIAIVMDGISVTEYARREGVTVGAISHRMETAMKNFKKVFPKSSTFPSSKG